MNFIAKLCDGTTDTSINEQEFVYFFVVDPDTIEPKLTFFECLRLESSQDTNSILDAIMVAFSIFPCCWIMRFFYLLMEHLLIAERNRA